MAFDNSAASAVGSGLTDTADSYNNSFGSGWWDTNGGDVIDGIGNTLGGLFQALPGIIAASNSQPGQAPFFYGPQQPQPAAMQAAPQQNTLMYIIIIVAILLVVVGGIYLFTRKSQA